MVIIKKSQSLDEAFAENKPCIAQKNQITNLNKSQQDFPYHLTDRNLGLNGLSLLTKIPSQSIATCFFDPQYRGILDKQQYGNEGQQRGQRRAALQQMSTADIIAFIIEIQRVLRPSGHLFLWVDKFHICEGVSDWFTNTTLKVVDLIVWEKPRFGMGYRTRNKAEFLMVYQKKPVKAKGFWTIHNIPNVWAEAANTKNHTHAKPLNLQAKLIEATTKPGDIVLDPAMGGGSVLIACRQNSRTFIGTDLVTESTTTQ